MLLTIARILSLITPWLFPISIFVVIIAVVVDLLKKRFYWSKFALIFFVITVILLVIQMQLIYRVTGDILNNPTDETASWKTYIDDVNGFSFKYPEYWYSEKIDNPKNDPYVRPTGVGKVSGFGYPYTRFSKLDNKTNRQLTISIINQSLKSLEKELKLPPSVSADGRETLKYATGVYILLDPSVNKVLWIYVDEYPNEFLEKILSTFKFTQ